MKIKEAFSNKPKPDVYKFSSPDTVAPQFRPRFERLVRCYLSAKYTRGDARRRAASDIAHGRYLNAFPVLGSPIKQPVEQPATKPAPQQLPWA